MTLTLGAVVLGALKLPIEIFTPSSFYTSD
jgi:hypothetical protein